MEIKSNKLGPWTKSNPPDALSQSPACLISGTDAGGITDLVIALTSQGDRIVLEGNEINFQSISAHTETLSLFGTQNIVLLRGATEKHAKDIERILDAGINPGSQLIVQAGSLKGNSKLKKLFTADKSAKSVILYAMKSDEIPNFVKDVARECGCDVDRSCFPLISSEVSGDRALAARTAETLSLHAIGHDRTTITREDVQAICLGVDESDMSSPFDFALQGRLPQALRALDDKMLRGENAITLIRIFTYRLNRFLTLAETGLAPSAAIAKARPPVFWTEKDMFSRILSRHKPTDLIKILIMLDRVEHQIIEKGAKPSLAMQDLLMKISKGGLKWPKL